MNDLTRKLGIAIPIIQAPMGGAVGPRLAAAVSNAGGLGTLPLWWQDVADLRLQLHAAAALTSRPFAVNLNLNYPQEDRLAACLEEGVRIISLFWGDPKPLMRRARLADAVVLCTVSDTEAARQAVDAGADIIVAQGYEAGGHVRGTVATLALVPAVVDAVAPVPVVAAGGIADGRGLAAALALGASGAWIGTRFLASSEAEIHPDYRDLLLDAGENDTVYTDLFDVGWPDAPHRVLRNSTYDDWDDAGRPPPGLRPGEGDILATAPVGPPVLRYQSHTPKPDDVGDIEAMSLWCGQGIALVRNVQPAAEIVEEIWTEACAVIDRLGAAT